MGNNQGAKRRRDPSEGFVKDARLSEAFKDAYVLLPWTVDLQLLSVLIPASKSNVGLMNVGSLGNFLSRTTEEERANKEAIEQLTAEIRSCSGERIGQRISQHVGASPKKVAELFFGAEPADAEATLKAFMGNSANLQLDIEQLFMKWVNDEVLLQLRLDLSEGSAARTILKGWGKGCTVIYVVNKIYQTTTLTFTVDEAGALGGAAGVQVSDLRTQGGLRMRKDQDRAALFHVESTDTDAQGQALPFSIAFSCWKIPFDSEGYAVRMENHHVEVYSKPSNCFATVFLRDPFELTFLCCSTTYMRFYKSGGQCGIAGGCS
jgi:hypothetical protein